MWPSLDLDEDVDEGHPPEVSSENSKPEKKLQDKRDLEAFEDEGSGRSYSRRTCRRQHLDHKVSL